LQQGFSSIPYCCYLYVTDNSCAQVSDNVIDTELMPGHFQRNRAERPCYLGRVIDGSNNDLNFAFVRYFDNKDIIFLRFMVISIGQRNGAVFSFPHLFAQALPPAGHNKNIYITSP
jgi:hypothetical protein